MGEDPALLECRGLTKRFGPTLAVHDVSLTLPAGRVLALVGENGAGKSTLMNMIAGSVVPDYGEIRLDGAALPRGAGSHAAAGIAMVHQELSLFANLTVAENLLLGREPLGPLGIDEAQLESVAQRVLDDLGIEINSRTRVAELSPGQQQLIEIAKAVAQLPRVLILDEPTSSLENPQVDMLHAVTSRLGRSGTAILFVSHRMDELFRFCDDVLVMRGGEAVAAGPLGDFTRDRLISAMVGRDVSQLYPPRSPGAAGEPVISLDHVSGDGLEDVNLTARAGAITGLAGLEGHGQSIVAEVLAGARHPRFGTVRLDGKPVRLANPRAAIRRGIGYVPPDRRGEGLLLTLAVAVNMTVTAAEAVHGGRLVRVRREARAVHGVVQRLSLKLSSQRQPVSELSGGNQQKVLFGRWLLHPGLRVLVLNDPTRGVDIGARAEIYGLLRELTDRGVAIVLVSTDMQELLGMADEIYTMYTGRVTGVLRGDTATEEQVMRLAVGEAA